MTNLNQRIEEWLHKTGYPLEMAAAAELRQAGFDVRQAITYSDAGTHKAREIDVHAFKGNLFGDVALSLVVECKRSERPWVVFTSPHALSGFNRIFALGFSSEALRHEIVTASTKDEFFKRLDRPDRCGYSLKQAMSGDQDPGYAASTSLVASTLAVLRQGTRGTTERFHLVLPVLVVDAPIFEASLTQSGAVELVPVESSEFLYGWEFEDHGPTCIRIVARGALRNFGIAQLDLAEAVNALVERRSPEDRNRTVPAPR